MALQLARFGVPLLACLDLDSNCGGCYTLWDCSIGLNKTFGTPSSFFLIILFLSLFFSSSTRRRKRDKHTDTQTPHAQNHKLTRTQRIQRTQHTHGSNRVLRTLLLRGLFCRCQHIFTPAAGCHRKVSSCISPVTTLNTHTHTWHRCWCTQEGLHEANTPNI